MQLAAKAAVLEVPVNFDRLYEDPDPAYLAAVTAWVDEVEDVRLRIRAEMEADAALGR